MVHNFNLGIGWASSGVEYAQAYRAKVLKNLGIEAKFYFADLFRQDNIEHMTKNIGLEDEQVVWLYQYYTDFHVAPCSIPIEEFARTFEQPADRTVEKENMIQYIFESKKMFVNVYHSKVNTDKVQRVEYVCGGYLVRTDYYSYAKMFSEFFAPREGQARVFLRRFYNEDGSTAFEELVDERKDSDKRSVFRFPDRMYFSREEFLEAILENMQFSPEDIVIADRSTTLGQPVFKHYEPAKMVIVIHADHYNENMSDDHHILWNNYYEYDFMNTDKIRCYITSTDIQNKTMKEQFRKYTDFDPEIRTIPVGALECLREPEMPRKDYSLVTASRLATEKHVDWIVKAVIKAHERIPQVTLDIYGKGQEENKIKKLIEEAGAQDYIRMMGHQDMSDRYVNYSAYIAASTSEGFGLTLMEAVGSGLSMLGFDVPYGNQTFIAEGENGYLLPRDRENDGPEEMIQKLTAGIERLFLGSDLKAFSEKSYEIASEYLTDRIEEKWKRLVEEL